jgi:hypothetical protein
MARAAKSARNRVEGFWINFILYFGNVARAIPLRFWQAACKTLQRSEKRPCRYPSQQKPLLFPEF